MWTFGNSNRDAHKDPEQRNKWYHNYIKSTWTGTPPGSGGNGGQIDNKGISVRPFSRPWKYVGLLDEVMPRSDPKRCALCVFQDTYPHEKYELGMLTPNMQTIQHAFKNGWSRGEVITLYPRKSAMLPLRPCWWRRLIACACGLYVGAAAAAASRFAPNKCLQHWSFDCLTGLTVGSFGGCNLCALKRSPVYYLNEEARGDMKQARMGTSVFTMNMARANNGTQWTHHFQRYPRGRLGGMQGTHQVKVYVPAQACCATAIFLRAFTAG